MFIIIIWHTGGLLATGLRTESLTTSYSANPSEKSRQITAGVMIDSAAHLGAIVTAYTHPPRDLPCCV